MQEDPQVIPISTLIRVYLVLLSMVVTCGGVAPPEVVARKDWRDWGGGRRGGEGRGRQRPSPQDPIGAEGQMAVGCTAVGSAVAVGFLRGQCGGMVAAVAR